jgi:hypothetical protein
MVRLACGSTIMHQLYNFDTRPWIGGICQGYSCPQRLLMGTIADTIGTSRANINTMIGAGSRGGSYIASCDARDMLRRGDATLTKMGKASVLFFGKPQL